MCKELRFLVENQNFSWQGRKAWLDKWCSSFVYLQPAKVPGVARGILKYIPFIRLFPMYAYISPLVQFFYWSEAAYQVYCFPYQILQDLIYTLGPCKQKHVKKVFFNFIRFFLMFLFKKFSTLKLLRNIKCLSKSDLIVHTRNLYFLNQFIIKEIQKYTHIHINII